MRTKTFLIKRCMFQSFEQLSSSFILESMCGERIKNTKHHTGHCGITCTTQNAGTIVTI